MSRIEEKQGKATAWALAFGIGIPVGLGLWFGWPGPWWFYVALGAIVFFGGLGGWVQSVRQDEIHQATIEMNERQKREQDPPEGGCPPPGLRGTPRAFSGRWSPGGSPLGAGPW